MFHCSLFSLLQRCHVGIIITNISHCKGWCGDALCMQQYDNLFIFIKLVCVFSFQSKIFYHL